MKPGETTWWRILKEKGRELKVLERITLTHVQLVPEKKEGRGADDIFKEMIVGKFKKRQKTSSCRFMKLPVCQTWRGMRKTKCRSITVILLTPRGREQILKAERGRKDRYPHRSSNQTGI